MGRARGFNAGGGQSSLGYLFGGGETSNNNEQNAQDLRDKDNADSQNATTTQSVDDNNQKIAAGIHGTLTNNYHRADGQNCGNFITNRSSTRVHYAPGGTSSLGYLFGGGGGK